MNFQMDNQVFGIITVLFCLMGYYFAVRKFRQGDILISILLLVACGLVLRLFTSADFFLHEWDERYHALVAKNLMSHPFKPTLYDTPIIPYDFKNWTDNHIWLHKQPLPLWTMAASMSLIGVNEIGLRLPSILMTTLGIWITFSIGRYLFNNRIGFIAAFLYSIHGLIIELSAGRVATEYVDIAFLFFIQLAVLFAIRFAQKKNVIYNLLCGVSIGLAILSKGLPALIVLPLWLLLVLDSKGINMKQSVIQFTLLIMMTAVVALPWQIYIHQIYPTEAIWESSNNLRRFTKVFEGHDGPLYYHFNKLRIIFGELVYLPLIWFIWYTVKGRMNYKRLVLLCWFIVPYLFFSIAKTKMPGYIMFTAPAIFIITGLFWHYLYLYRKRFRLRWLIYTILVLLLALPIRYSIERIKPFSKIERNPVWAKELKELGKTIEPGSKVVLFNVDRPIEAMFYINCTAYRIIPDLETINDITKSGYKILINDAKELESSLYKRDNVEFIRIRD